MWWTVLSLFFFLVVHGENWAVFLQLLWRLPLASASTEYPSYPDGVERGEQSGRVDVVSTRRRAAARLAEVTPPGDSFLRSISCQGRR